jgi:hypothetical protein
VALGFRQGQIPGQETAFAGKAALVLEILV